jgi:hypothetical protein
MVAPALRVALAGALLATAGCASGGLQRSGSPFSNDPRERNEVRIHVLNHNFSDATVWTLVRDGRRTRLGMVTGKDEASFTVPWRFSEPLRLQFDLVAGPRCTTENIMVDPGDELEMQIAVDFAMMYDWCR